MKRKFFAIMLAFVMCFAVAGLCIGCASKSNEKTAYELWLADGHSGTMDDFYNWLDTRPEQGPAGEAGVGIQKIEADENGMLVITYTNGKTSDPIAIPAGPKGEAGEPGKGIADIKFVDGNIVVKYDDGSEAKIPFAGKGCAEHNMEMVEVIPHTMKADGSFTKGAYLYVCNNCGSSLLKKNEVIHTFVETVIAPTCTAQGYTVDLCSCGLEDGDRTNFTDMIDHDWKDAGYTAVLPGQTLCEHGGYLVETCENCDAVREVEEIAPQGHAVDTWSITAPKKDATGTAVAACKRCGANLLVTLPTLASDIYNTETVRLEELCTQKINTTYTLWANYLDKDGKLLSSAELSKEAGNGAIEIKFEVKYESGYHTLGGHLMIESVIDADVLVGLGGVEFPTQKATCTQNGAAEYTCDVCDARMFISTTRKHTYETNNIDEDDIIRKPTCDEPGKATGVCTVCKQEGRFDIPAMSHELVVTPSADNKKITITCSNYTEGLVAGPCSFHSGVTYNVVGTPEIVAATCQEAGSITFKYDDNGTIKTQTLELAITGHKCGETVVKGRYISVEDLLAGGGQEFPTQKADCGHTGKAYFTCSDCEANIFVETEKHGEHKIDTKADSYQAPTCTKPGVGYCSVCRLSGSDLLPALGHDYKYVETVGLDGTITLTVTCEREGEGDADHCDALVDVLHTINLSELLANIDPENDIIKVSDPSCTTEGLTQYLVKLENVLNAKGEPVTYVHEVKVAKENHLLNGKEVPHDKVDAEYFVSIGGQEFPTQQATCAKNGAGDYVCDVCGNRIFVETTGESRHLYVDEPVIVLPGCTEPGSETGTCTRPGCLTSVAGKVEKVLPALGHVYQIEVKENPTHSADGYAMITCAGRANAEGELVCDAHDHDPVNIRVPLIAIDRAPAGTYTSLGKTAPTCSEAGQEKYAASIKVEGIKQRFDIEFANVIPALGHTEPEVKLAWSVERVLKVALVDDKGAAIKDKDGNAVTYDLAVEYRYVGYTCDTCHSMHILSVKTFVNGHEVTDLDEVTYREVKKVVVVDGEEETKIFVEYLVECVDYVADCIDANHEVILSSEEKVEVNA